VFTSAGTGSPAATAAVAGGVLTVAVTAGSFSSGSFISFVLPATVKNVNSVQFQLRNVSSCVIDFQGVIIASSAFGTYPAVNVLNGFISFQIIDIFL
jgi:hypothetical protein